jgi:hypothetical protein
MLWDESGDRLILADNAYLSLGTGSDALFYHTGSDCNLGNYTGHFQFINYADDKDIVFKCDDGSGGVETYFFLDGSLSSGNPYTIFPDNSHLTFGDGTDLQIYHNATHSYIDNYTGDLYIRNNANDKDIIFQCDDGSGGVDAYFWLDGSALQTTFVQNITFYDNIKIKLGTSADLQLYSDGSNTIIDSYNCANMLFRQHYADGDMTFQCDDGSGGVETYFYLDGSASSGDPITIFPDNSQLRFGSDGVRMYHNGTDSHIQNRVGDLYIYNNANDKDIIFQNDDGSGGTEIYFFLDGSLSSGNPYTIFPDNSHLTFGDGADCNFAHDGTNTTITNKTGDFRIVNEANDCDIIFKSDDGSGGTETYFYLDGSVSSGSPFTIFPDNSRLCFGTSNDLRIVHDGSNSYIMSSGAGDLYIQQHNDDKDLVFQCDDGSGGTETYFYLDGSLSSGSPYTVFPDNSQLALGSSGSDFRLYHDGTNSWLNNATGDLKIRNSANDKDIIFECDDGAGNVATYFYLDGSYSEHGIDGETNTVSTVFPDHALLALGTHRDLKLWYNNVRGRIAYTGGNEFVITALNNLNIGFNDSDASHTETAIQCIKDGEVRLRHDNSEKFRTLTDGAKVTGAMALTETTTPTATADVGKVYTKSDNKLYFQDGAGTEHEVAFSFESNVTGISNVNYTALATDYIIHYATLTTSGKTVTIPTALCTEGRVLIIKDGAGTAAMYNITIDPEGENIDGAATKVINSNYGSVTLYADHLGANWFTI